MTTRRCARCGTSVGQDEYLCWDCRQELPAQTPAPAMAGAAGGAAQSTTGTPTDVERTFRGARVPKGMVLPSRVQYHGTVFGFIAVGIVLVMVLGLLVSSGVGPFIASAPTVSQTADAATGTAKTTVTATVTNRGTHEGKARCVALYTTGGGGGQIPTQSVTTAVIPAHATGSVSIDLPTGAEAGRVTVDCK
jgi:hypothetical protein